MEKNYIYEMKGDYEYVSKPVTKKQLETVRKNAQALLKKTKGQALGMRSCWVCNGAHTHFLSGEWGDWVLMCIAECGRYYYDKTDITQYDEPKGREGQ